MMVRLGLHLCDDKGGRFMTIRSVDMQVLVQRAGDVSKIQQVQQVQNATKHQENLQQIMQQTTIVSKTVEQNRETESKRVHEEKEKEKRKKQGKKRPKDDEGQLKESESGSIGIDIIV